MGDGVETETEANAGRVSLIARVAAIINLGPVRQVEVFAETGADESLAAMEADSPLPKVGVTNSFGDIARSVGSAGGTF